MRWVLRGKIHRATVTENRLNYAGSVTIDATLTEKAGIWDGELVHIANVNNGARFQTYAITGERDSGIIALNGAAARLCEPGDLVIIMGYELTDKPIKPSIVKVDGKNRITEVS